MAPAILPLVPEVPVPLLLPDEDLLADMSPNSAIGWEEDVADLAHPPKGWLSLASRVQEPLPDRDLLLKVLAVLRDDVALCLRDGPNCLEAELATHSGGVDL
eukprot:CAMPEP_0180465662 /NCGR_PEP_ID=MMETSP1036_2-20121128/26071_1 /TAXON_ID=632150 /ORGANISM="Azadinium spinosum, Strain 3D9" /LENGTH=101 /DNA_ID=CAMNT_0022472543 /DNA_START=162 /DNA_END=467 /DNA_ORIENTATION=+